VLGAEEHPRCATTEPEGRTLRIKTPKTSRDQSLTQGIKFGCLTRLGAKARHLFFVVSRPVRGLLLSAKGLFVSDKIVRLRPPSHPAAGRTGLEQRRPDRAARSGGT
jgi:hypothetical protein